MSQLLCYMHYCPKPCAQCAARVLTPSQRKSPSIIVFGEHVYEHMYHPWETPEPISSPERLRTELESRGMYSERLRGSTIWRSEPERWV